MTSLLDAIKFTILIVASSTVGTLIAVLILRLISTSAHAAALSKAKVEFTAPTNMGLTVKGKAEEGLAGNFEGETGEASFELKKLDTGMGLRNTHMLEDLHADTHPVAVLKWNGPVADLTLNGKTKTIALIHNGKVYNFEVVLSDFGISARKHLGVGIQGTVRVEVTVP